MPQMAMKHDVDPAKEILDKIGNLKDFELFGNQILIGIYKRPERTKSGIMLADQTRQEDEYQGKAGLVLKLGPAAFVSDANYDFGVHSVQAGGAPKPGDWVAIFVSDGRKIVINGQLCRLVDDQFIRLRIPAPDAVF